MFWSGAHWAFYYGQRGEMIFQSMPVAVCERCGAVIMPEDLEDSICWHELLERFAV